MTSLIFSRCGEGKREGISSVGGLPIQICAVGRPWWGFPEEEAVERSGGAVGGSSAVEAEGAEGMDVSDFVARTEEGMSLDEDAGVGLSACMDGRATWVTCCCSTGCTLTGFTRRSARR